MKKYQVAKITLLFLLVFCAFSYLIISAKNTYSKNKKEELIQNVVSNLEKEKIQEENIIAKDITFEDGAIGLIIIPSIEVEAPIYEGTNLEVLKYSVGHFENTSLWSGNVALASHNRGSYAHYFSRINELKNGEEIIYITNMGERRYKVTESKIIKETNVEVLENTEENIITLITCVTGKKDKRQCVIGKQFN